MRRKVLSFAILEVFFWCIWASFGGFYAAYGLSRGYSQSAVSVMLSVYFVCAFAGQFIWGSISDKLHTNKKAFIFGVIGGWGILLVMYILRSPLSYAVCYGLYGLTMGPMSSILDTWILKSLNGDVIAYSKARGCGSLGYAVWILAVGQLIRMTGYWVMPVFASVMTALSLILAFRSEDAPSIHRQNEKVDLKDIFSILQKKTYLLILVIVFFFGLCMAPVNNLKIMILEDVGGDVATNGVDSSVANAIQCLLFFFAGAFRMIRPKMRLLVGSAAILIALVIDYFSASVGTILVGSCLMYGSYSLFLPAARELVVSNIDYKFQTTANGLVDASYNALAGTLALLFAGNIAENFGIKTMILITVCIAVVPVVITAISAVGDFSRQKSR